MKPSLNTSCATTFVSLAATLLAASPASALRCDTDVVPAATLLVPYFEVSLERPESLTTLFSVTNVDAVPALVNVVLWTDFAIPTLSFEVYLAGFDVQTFNVKDLVLDGRFPVTGSAVSPHGRLSDPPVDFPGCNQGATPGSAPVYPDPALGPQELARLQAFHTGVCFGGKAAGGFGIDPTVAHGYITVDVVQRCSGLTPADPGYFAGDGSGVASNRNVLTGDFFLVDAEEDYAQGEQAVHVEALPGAFSPGDYTFYRRYVAASAIDHREPLGTQYAVRHLKGGGFDGGTDFLVWRDTGSAEAEPVDCEGSPPSWYGGYGLESFTVLISEEGETARSSETGLICEILPPCPDIRKFPLATQSVLFGSGEFPSVPPDGTQFGMTYINLRRASTVDPEDWPVLQGWVVATNSALGRFSVGQRAMRLDSACNPGPSLFVPADLPE